MSARSLCLRCWRQVAIADASYRCPACVEQVDERPAWLGTPEMAPRKVKDIKRPFWHRLWSDRGDQPPRCELHPDTEAQLLCPCGHPRAAGTTLGRARPVALGFAGPRGAGKTLLTITMIRALRGLVLGGRSVGVLGVDGTEERFRALAEAFLDRGLQPHPTLPEQLGEPTDDSQLRGNFCWELMVERERRAVGTAFLAVFDLAGETWSAPAAELAPRFDRYLGLVGSIVFLVDGASIAADLGLGADDAWSDGEGRSDGGAAELTVLRNLIDRLGARRRTVDLALVVSKADLLWDEPDWQALRPAATVVADAPAAEAVESLLAKAQRRDLLLAARKHFRKVELFAASSLGFRPGDGDVDGRSLTTPVRPAGVLEPILWLLTQRLPGLRES